VKYKEQLVYHHALEIDALSERHKADMKRRELEIEIANTDKTSKIKHLHEQVCPVV